MVIVADDLGYSDLGCYGSEIETPALDHMAKQGVRLARFRNGGMCVISRASLLTGQWWPRALERFDSTPLISERLKDVGYRTAIIGKWHLNGDPMDRGFDHFFGFLSGFADHFQGAPSYRLDRKPFTDFGENYYSSNALTDRAIRFIHSTHSEKDDAPFFLYLSYQAPHNPLQAPREQIDKYRGRYLAGWRAIRESRFKRQKEYGIISQDAVLPDAPENLPEWDSLSNQQKDLEDLRMAVYAAMVHTMDQGIGRLVDVLEESGKLDNTLLLFISDNGTDSFSVVDDAMLAQGRLPGDRQSNWQPGTGWAYASVTPWRLYKISQHAGGVTSGGIAWWPSRMKHRGRIIHTPVHVVDVAATLADACGIETVDLASSGHSFLSDLVGGVSRPSETQYFQYMDNRAIRTDQWTLVEVDAAGWELFRAADDPLENQDLAKHYPEIVSKLDAQWSTWWREQHNGNTYQPTLTRGSQHYRPQGDRGSGEIYCPRAMPQKLSDRYPIFSGSTNPK